MSETISCLQITTLGSGQTWTLSIVLSVDAYDVVDVTIPDAATDREVQVQPGGTGQVQFLLISSDLYAGQLTYKVNSVSATQQFALDSPQIFSGAGALSMLGSTPPTSLFFSNSAGKAATIGILVGRKALV